MDTNAASKIRSICCLPGLQHSIWSHKPQKQFLLFTLFPIIYSVVVSKCVNHNIEFFPRSLGKRSSLARIVFNRVVQPPTSLSQSNMIWTWASVVYSYKNFARRNLIIIDRWFFQHSWFDILKKKLRNYWIRFKEHRWSYKMISNDNCDYHKN